MYTAEEVITIAREHIAKPDLRWITMHDVLNIDQDPTYLSVADVVEELEAVVWYNRKNAAA